MAAINFTMNPGDAREHAEHPGHSSVVAYLFAINTVLQKDDTLTRMPRITPSAAPVPAIAETWSMTKPGIHCTRLPCPIAEGPDSTHV